MTKKKINVCNVNYVRVHGTKSYDWNSKNSSYDDDLTISKNNVCRIKQVDLLFHQVKILKQVFTRYDASV